MLDRLSLKIVPLFVIGVLLVNSCSPPPSPEAELPAAIQESMPDSEAEAAVETLPEDAFHSHSDDAEHQDHHPRHDGTFFMALDGVHHLEGVLVQPGTFLVYLYDAFTKPLNPRELKQAQGRLQWGESEDAPEIPLRVSEDGQALEARWAARLSFRSP